MYDSLAFKISRIIAAAMLLWALAEHQYGYFTLLRFVVFGICGYGAYISFGLNKIGWIWTFGVIAVVFNPIIPIHLDRDTWKMVDLGVAGILVLSLFSYQKSKVQKM